MKSFLIFTSIFIAFAAQAQTTFTLVSIPDYTPEMGPIYMAGDFNGWTPNDAQYALAKNENDLWEITLNGFAEGTTIEFKFTRGSWETVEKGAEGEEIGDRSFTFGNGETVEITIANWADHDEGGSNPSTTAENVHIIDEAFYMPQLNRSRRIWIYLPPDYEDSQEDYPVIYMHDGQNVFDATTSFSGEWEVDETLNALAAEGYRVPIVVGIDNGGTHRMDEYLPYYFPNLNAGGEGDEYMAFIVETLKPFIDQTYRTLSDRENTALIGSSLGGVISLYGALKYQNIFSKSAPFSPAYWANYNEMFTFLAETGKQADIRFYQNVGENEGEQYIQAMNQMENALMAEGFNQVYSTVLAGGEHNEATWASDFRNAYLWLFADYATVTSIQETTTDVATRLYPNPVKDVLHITLHHHTKASTIQIIRMDGQVVKKITEPTSEIAVSDLDTGIYYLCIYAGDTAISVERFIKL